METPTKSVQNASPQDVRFRVAFEAGDPANPQNFAPLYKTWLVLQMSLLALAGALGSSIISSAETEIGPYIAVGPEVTSLAVALYVLGLFFCLSTVGYHASSADAVCAGWALGPMIWGPTSELFGRRIGMLPGMLVMACFTLGTAGSTTAAGIFMTRFMGGIFASAPISNVPAALGDLYRPDARGIAMTLVSICISGGPTLGPLIGAAIVSNEKLGWRWTMYIQAIFVFCLVALCFFCLPETYAPVLLKAKAKQLRKTTGEQRYWHPHEKEKIELNNILTKYLSRPLRMLLTEPLVTCLALYASFTYSLIYLTLEVFPIVFREHRQWAPIPSTLPFLGIFVGTICAAPINLANQPAYKRAMAKNGGKGVPEARLPPLIVGGVLLNAGLFWFGWTAAPKYMWLLPTVAGGFFGAGFTVVFQQCLNFLVDAYGPYAASAVSANTILRSILACAMPIAARPMFINMGVAPAASLLGGISCLALPVPFLFMRYTTFLRRRSRFATA